MLDLNGTSVLSVGLSGTLVLSVELSGYFQSYVPQPHEIGGGTCLCCWYVEFSCDRRGGFSLAPYSTRYLICLLELPSRPLLHATY